MNLQKMVQGYMSVAIANKIAKKFGLSPKHAKTVVALIVPILLTAMAKNASKGKKEASSLFGAIQNDHDGNIFTQLDTVGSTSKKSEGEKILQHILGGQTDRVVSALAQREGLQADQVGDIMKTIAPLVMGALGKEQSEKSLDTNAMTDLFAQQQEASTQQGAQNPLFDLLDQDGDGSARGEILSMGMKALKNFGKK